MWLSVFKYLAWVGQLGLSLVLPPVLALWLANWLKGRLALGAWVYPIALVLGLLTSVTCFVRFLRMVQREAGEKHEGP